MSGTSGRVAARDDNTGRDVDDDDDDDAETRAKLRYDVMFCSKELSTLTFVRNSMILCRNTHYSHSVAMYRCCYLWDLLFMYSFWLLSSIFDAV